MIWQCFPGSCWLHAGYMPIPRLESPPETSSQLVTISQNDGLSSCFLPCLEPGALFLGERSPCTHFTAALSWEEGPIRSIC